MSDIKKTQKKIKDYFVRDFADMSTCCYNCAENSGGMLTACICTINDNEPVSPFGICQSHLASPTQGIGK